MADPATVAKILNDAADLISDPKNFVRDYASRGFNPSEVERGDHLKANAVQGSCLPSGSHAERWNAVGAIWRTALIQHEAVRQAHTAFHDVCGHDVSLSRWCAAHEQADQVAALRRAAERASMAEAA